MRWAGSGRSLQAPGTRATNAAARVVIGHPGVDQIADMRQVAKQRHIQEFGLMQRNHQQSERSGAVIRYVPTLELAIRTLPRRRAAIIGATYVQGAMIGQA